MNFQNIEYFIAVVEQGNFTKAAQSLFISQQSLSENIRRLEEEVGTPLLNRGRVLTLTPAGKCFLSGGRKILSTQDKMLREIAVISNTCRCKIILRTLDADIPPFLPAALSRFTQKYPEYEVIVNPVDMEEIPDFTFQCQEPGKNMESIPLIKNDIIAAVVSKTLAEQVYGNDWEAVKACLVSEKTLASLTKLPFLILCENRRIHPVFEQLFDDAGFTPIEAFKSEDANLLSSVCSNGSGVFLGPLDYCRRKFGPLMDKKTGSLLCFPLNTPVQITLSLVYPRGKHLNQAEKRFVDVLRSAITG